VSESALSRSRSMRMPRRPAIAVRWISALVDPPRELGRAQAGVDEPHRERPGLFRRAQPIRVDGGDRCRAGRHESECLGEAGHGAGGAHHAAGAGRGCEPALDLANPLAAHLPRAIGCPVAPAIRAGRKTLALIGRREHRASDELHRRDIGGHRAHELRRHRLVAATDQDRSIHRLRREHRLGVQSGQVAIVHAGREQRGLAERYRGKR
jgi:hypothetical protein